MDPLGFCSKEACEHELLRVLEQQLKVPHKQLSRVSPTTSSPREPLPQQAQSSGVGVSGVGAVYALPSCRTDTTI